jgi:ubiquinone/menaquinone biosynthesis C-methylase UbiE
MKNYLESCQTEFWKQVFEKELEYALRELRGCKNVLSIGCGPAIIERGLQEHGLNVTGLDISKEVLEGAPDIVRTIIGSAEEMEFKNSSFDAVIYVSSLQFIRDYKKAICETSRVLRQGGKLIAMLLNPESKFFKEKRKQPASYVNKIKHPYLIPIEEAIREHFVSVNTEYYLGIEEQKIFLNQNPKFASLYIIQGVKK